MDVSDCKSVCVKLSLLWLPDTLHAPVPSCFWKQQHLLGQARAEDGGDVAGKVIPSPCPAFTEIVCEGCFIFQDFHPPAPKALGVSWLWLCAQDGEDSLLSALISG